MNYRPLGRTPWKVSEISFGAWAIGGSWGSVDDSHSLAALNRAVDCGVNFIDTADVYGMGRSEKLIARLKRDRKDEIIVATKAGRRLPSQAADGYNRANLTTFIEDSLRNLATDCLDILDDLMSAGKIRYYGVSVERVEEALKAIEYPHVQTVQIIFNCFRLRPSSLFFAEAKRKQVGILARVPLASGLLSGKLTRETKFAQNDHRNFNRHGEEFDVGETFSGVDYETALDAVAELRKLSPTSLAQFALRWILMFPEVSCAIPGAKTPNQAEENCAASDLPPLSAETMAAVAKTYDEKIRPLVHQRW